MDKNLNTVFSILKLHLALQVIFFLISTHVPLTTLKYQVDLWIAELRHKYEGWLPIRDESTVKRYMFNVSEESSKAS